MWPTHQPTSGGCALSVRSPDQSRVAGWHAWKLGSRRSWALLLSKNAYERSNRRYRQLGSNAIVELVSRRPITAPRSSRTSWMFAAPRVAVAARRSESLLVSTVPGARILAGPTWTPDGSGTRRGGTKVGTRMRPRFG